MTLWNEAANTHPIVKNCTVH